MNKMKEFIGNHKLKLIAVTFFLISILVSFGIGQYAFAKNVVRLISEKEKKVEKKDIKDKTSNQSPEETPKVDEEQFVAGQNYLFMDNGWGSAFEGHLLSNSILLYLGPNNIKDFTKLTNEQKLCIGIKGSYQVESNASGKTRLSSTKIKETLSRLFGSDLGFVPGNPNEENLSYFKYAETCDISAVPSSQVYYDSKNQQYVSNNTTTNSENAPGHNYAMINQVSAELVNKRMEVIVKILFIHEDNLYKDIEHKNKLATLATYDAGGDGGLASKFTTDGKVIDYYFKDAYKYKYTFAESKTQDPETGEKYMGPLISYEFIK